MNKKDNRVSNNSGFEDQPDFLNALFQQAKTRVPVLSDDNFTKLVLNQLSANPRRHRAKSSSFKWLQDLVGVVAGIGIMSAVVGPTQIGSVLNTLTPDTIILSATTVSAVALAFAGLSVLAYWRVEQS